MSDSEQRTQESPVEQSSEPLNLVEIPPVKVTADPPKVKAGEPFKVTVRLADFVGAGDRVFLRIKFQRILSMGRQIVLSDIDFGYFDPNQFPSFLELRHPDITATSGPAMVKTDASQPAGSPPVSFPEDLLITVFVESAPDKKCSQTIRVSPPA